MTSALKTYYINLSGGKKYPIIFGENAVENLTLNDMSQATKAMIVTNSTIASICDSFIKQLIYSLQLDVAVCQLSDGESFKSMDTVTTIVGKCLDHQMGRKDILFAIGGGVIGDM